MSFNHPQEVHAYDPIAYVCKDDVICPPCALLACIGGDTPLPIFPGEHIAEPQEGCGRCGDPFSRG